MFRLEFQILTAQILLKKCVRLNSERIDVNLALILKTKMKGVIRLSKNRFSYLKVVLRKNDSMND